MAKTFALSWTLLIVATAASSCGPMNSEKKSPGTSGGIAPTSLGAVNTSKEKAFLVYSSFQSSAEPSTAGSPQVGDNTYLIRCVHSSDLRGASDEAKITVTYWMPDMPAMGKSEATATRQSDGSYSFTVFYSMAGRWELIVTLEDGGKKDEYVFETTL